MLFFTIRRVLSSVVVVLVSSLLVFALCAASFDPLARYRQQQPAPTPEYLHSVAERLGLNDPFLVRYWHWLSGVVRGDFGETVNGTPVGPALFHRIGVTGAMMLLAVVVAILLAIVVGVIGAVRQYRLADHATTFLAYLLIALPVFWFAALLKQGAVGLNGMLGTQLFFTLGEESPGISSYARGWALAQDRLLHLVLPTISLALLAFASWSRFQRSAMLDVLGSDHLRLARAKGLPYWRAVRKHGLRNALGPLTTVVALSIGTLFGGAIITEQVFVWHGMGEFLIKNGIGNNDINVVLAWLLASAFFIVLFNLIADLLYAVLDPRVRLS